MLSTTPRQAQGLELILQDAPAAPALLVAAPSVSAVLACSVAAGPQYNPITGRQLLREQAPFFEHFYPKKLLVYLLKVSITAFLGRLTDVTKKVEELEEEDPQAANNLDVLDVVAPSRHRNEFNLWKGFHRNVQVRMFRELSVTTVQRTLETVAMECVSAKTGRSLVKSLSGSCVRKAGRYSSNMVVMNKVFESAFKGQIMYWTSFWLVNQLFDTYYTFVEAPKIGLDADEDKVAKYGRRLLSNTLQSVGACVLAAVGAAVGTAIRPGYGSFMGALLLPNLIFIVVV